MSSIPELSCFDCPIVCEIGNQLERSKSVRNATVEKTEYALGEFAVIEGTGGDASPLRERWHVTSEAIYAKLDDADKILVTNRTALLETCDEQRPSVIVPSPEGTISLKCNSALAEEAMRAVGMQTT